MYLNISLNKHLNKVLWAAQLKFDFDADKLLMNCKICANFVQSVYQLCAKTLPFAQNQLTVQVYTKPVYCTSVHKTSLLYKCTQN